MRAILVDDESSALTSLEFALHKIGGVTIIGKYTNSYIARENILLEKPDIVFLDIEMPGISGIKLAEEIQCSLPKVNIVFITAYDEYAVRAFELSAIDYILKPVRRNRLKETIKRISAFNRVKSTSVVSTQSPMICAFQKLSFAVNNNINETLEVRWRTSKVRGVFTFLLQHRGDYIRKDTLLELFWPDLDMKKGYTQLYSAIYQVRKTLSDANVDILILNLENGYKLDMNGVKFDVDEWENGIHELPALNCETLPAHQELISIYRGDYLASEDYLWAENERERLKILWIEHISKVADYLSYKNQFHKAISLYLRLQTSQPYSEETYFKLMQLYSKIGEANSVIQQYNYLKRMVLDQYDSQPRQDIQNWYKCWEKNRIKQKYRIS